MFPCPALNSELLWAAGVTVMRSSESPTSLSLPSTTRPIWLASSPDGQLLSHVEEESGKARFPSALQRP